MKKQFHTPGRVLQALTIGRGYGDAAAAYAESQGHWLDRNAVVSTVNKSVVTAIDTADFPSDMLSVADAFLESMRSYSIPMRLENLRKLPMHTRVYVNSAGVIVAEVAEGAAIPVLQGSWDQTTLAPRFFSGVVVQTVELARSTSPLAAAALTDDLAQATAEAENKAFVNPEVSGSVLYGAPAFVSSGSSAANIGTDLRHLFSLVPGSWRPGSALIMSSITAASVHFADPSLYPNVGPMGGSIAGTPVLVTAAAELAGSPSSRIVALITPQDILWSDRGRVVLSISEEAALQMDTAPTQNSATGTASTAVSLFQASAVATKAVRESAWYARPGAGAYFVVNF